MKKTAKGIVVILAAVMFVLCFSTQGSAKVNNRAKKLTKEFTNYAAYMAFTKVEQLKISHLVLPENRYVLKMSVIVMVIV